MGKMELPADDTTETVQTTDIPKILEESTNFTSSIFATVSDYGGNVLTFYIVGIFFFVATITIIILPMLVWLIKYR